MTSMESYFNSPDFPRFLPSLRGEAMTSSMPTPNSKRPLSPSGLLLSSSRAFFVRACVSHNCWKSIFVSPSLLLLRPLAPALSRSPRRGREKEAFLRLFILLSLSPSSPSPKGRKNGGDAHRRTGNGQRRRNDPSKLVRCWVVVGRSMPEKVSHAGGRERNETRLRRPQSVRDEEREEGQRLWI